MPGLVCRKCREFWVQRSLISAYMAPGNKLFLHVSASLFRGGAREY